MVSNGHVPKGPMMLRFFKSIEFVEQHLFDDVSVHEIAAASHYSTYHFSRVFKALVGDTPKEYLRKRRLTVAARQLLSEPISILDLALNCQFESQEAFARAFKSLFTITPAQYRKVNDPFRLLYKDQFSPHMLNHLQTRISMEPDIIVQPATKLVGIARQYSHADLDLAKLWSAFRPYRHNITNQLGSDGFGIYESYEEHGDEVRFVYLCSVPVSSFDAVPDGMTARELPEQMYARFVHLGPLADLEQSLKYIWGSWLPKSGYEYVERPDFELYRPGNLPGDPDKTLYLHIPVSKIT
ncbi:AraC family transcriptional regulator [Reinekea sp.]|jgi:AraC family transcriptional regulator|uniref:AraC family transcriptional regulator n=1 Tax=Reinekea sp. TaxID=1970455 RepID=UPI002A8345C4|nr:AraC family transcriptional regulator [Reinekea sp.]